MNDENPQKPLTYKDSGVDIDAGDALVDAIKPLAASTRRPGADAALGGFGGLFDLKAAGFKDPILVSGADGVGTKLLVAIETGMHETVGVDLVAMCVNDILAQGAEPLFFLDYFATGRLEPGVAAKMVAGVAEGCRQAGCALVGGETAEMPGMYGANHYDMAGCAVGAVERGAVLPRVSEMVAGDVLIALPSSGPHSNGYSLVRKIVERSGLDWEDPAPFAEGLTVGEALLASTRIYVKALLPLIRAGKLKGLAHITGGGITENTPRMLPDHLKPKIDLEAWAFPPVFEWMQKIGQISDTEMLRTFNCGVGMIVSVAADDVMDVLSALAEADESAFVIGEVAEA